MATQVTSPPATDHHLLDHLHLDELKASVRDLIDRTSKRPFATRATEAIKDHPFVAVAVAAGLSYLVVRMARHL